MSDSMGERAQMLRQLWKNEWAKSEPSQVKRLRESLGHALAQWRMYAEMGEDRDLRTEQTAEAALWREMKVEAGEILLVPPRHHIEKFPAPDTGQSQGQPLGPEPEPSSAAAPQIHHTAE